MARGKKTGGRVKGTPNRATERQRRFLEAVNEDDRQIIDRTIADAKAGNLQAVALYYRFLRPPRPRLNPTPIEMTKPETIADVRAAAAELMIKAMGGELDLDAAGAASAFLKAIESSILGFDLAQLLAELKAKAR
jgi:hypothetical protein